VNVARSKKLNCALTLVEVLVVLAVLWILAAIILPPLVSRPARAPRIQCVNNLKQIGLAMRVWDGDHGDKFPMSFSETNGGTMEFTTGPNVFRHFQVISNV
jgi:type II secretory pathway pseudopilin PulG